jgi:hypothetical protein
MILLDASIRVVALAAVVFMILRLAGVKSSRVEHAAWTTVLIAMLTMPVLTWLAPPVKLPFTLPMLPADRAQTVSLFELTDQNLPQPQMGDTASVSLSSAAVQSHPVFASGPSGSAPLPSRRPSWAQAMIAMYLTGAAMFLFRFVAGWIVATRVAGSAVRTSIRASVPVFESPQVSTPVTIGAIRPRVVLPAGWAMWPAEKLDAVVAHETAHVQRRDPLITFVARLNLAIFWFHPAAWWLNRVLTLTAEHACDEDASRLVGRQRYASLLIELAKAAQLHGGRLQGVAVDGTGLVGARVKRLIAGEPFAAATTLQKALVATTCLSAVFLAAACRQSSPEPLPLREDPTLAKQLAERKANENKHKQIYSMSRAEIDRLEASLSSSPDDLETRETLRTFYKYAHDQKVFDWNEKIARRRSHILWWIEHHPDDPESVWRVSPTADRDGYAAARQAWLSQIAKASASPATFRRASLFFDSDEPELAEQLLREGQKRFPRDDGWSASLGAHYGRLLAGWGRIGESRNLKPIESDPRLRNLRDRLLASTDDELLEAAGGSGLLVSPDATRRALGRTFTQRALELNPGSPQAQIRMRRLNIATESEEQRRTHDAVWKKQHELAGDAISRKMQSGERLTNEESVLLQSAEFDAVMSLPLPDRLPELLRMGETGLMMAEGARHAGRPASVPPYVQRSKAAAMQALKEANALRDTPYYGEAIYRANAALALHVWREGDRQKAVAYLAEAVKAPPSSRLDSATFFSLDGRIVNYLIKGGERESVAKFLEASARLRKGDSERLLRDAAAIREGRMPAGYQRMYGSK